MIMPSAAVRVTDSFRGLDTLDRFMVTFDKEAILINGP